MKAEDLRPFSAVAGLATLLLPLALATSWAKAQEPAFLPDSQLSEEEIASQYFGPLIPARGKVGIVVGVIQQGQQRVHRFGEQNFDGDTIFEIGSVTKVFTALTLAAVVHDGTLNLSDPIEKFLPEGTDSPTRNSQGIQLVHLASHCSGLPRLPSNLSKWELARFGLLGSGNPYSGFDEENLYRALHIAKLKAEPGKRYLYSNFGAGLLGQILANAAESDYETVIRQRICEPLNMQDTWVSLPEEMSDRLAPPHLASGRPGSNWDLGALAGAGGVHSTANDLLILLEQHLAPANPKLKPAIEMALKERIEASEATSIGLGWHCTKDDDREFWWHNGGTGGYSSFAGMDRKTKSGVVVLANAALARELTRMAMRFLTVMSLPEAARQPEAPSETVVPDP